MGTMIDIILVVVLLLGTFLGMKKGLIKSAVSLVGMLAIVIISYKAHIPIANFLIDKMPFFSFAGTAAGLTALSILVYNAIAFIVVFVVLYCLLSIVISLTGFIDTLLKFTVIWALPSKIGGAIIGLIETWVFAFLIVFILGQFSLSQSYIADSKISNFMLDHTPIVANYLGGARAAAKDIYDVIEQYKNSDSKSVTDINLNILQLEIKYGLVTKEKATELVQTGKVDLGNVLFGKAAEDISWLNI